MASAMQTPAVWVIAAASAFVALAAKAQEQAAEGEALRGPSGEKATPARSPLYLSLATGLGYASLSEDRPDAKGLTNASKVTASGLAIPVYAALGYRVSSRVTVGGALLLADQPSPSIDFQL